jgi:hypothetical protein
MAHEDDSERFSVSRNPMQILALFGWIALVSVVVGAVLPGFIAYKDHVFFYDSTAVRVRSRKADVVPVLSRFEQEQSHLNQQVSEIDRKLLAANPSEGSASALLTLRQVYQSGIKATPISIQPFYHHILMYFWPTMFCGLGTAIFILGPTASGSRFNTRDIVAGRTLWIGIGVLVAFVGPFYFRVFATQTFAAGRRVYAYSNPDISTIGFVVQSLDFVLLSWLLAIVWSQWSTIAAAQRSSLAQQIDASEASFEILSELSKQFYSWQLTFISVSAGFVLYTGVFWFQIIRNGDTRFWYEGIVAHAMWFISLGVTALPLIVTWSAWRRHKLRLITRLLSPSNSTVDNLQARIDSIRSLGTVSNWNVALSAAGIIVTLVGPFIQARLK